MEISKERVIALPTILLWPSHWKLLYENNNYDLFINEEGEYSFFKNNIQISSITKHSCGPRHSDQYLRVTNKSNDTDLLLFLSVFFGINTETLLQDVIVGTLFCNPFRRKFERNWHNTSK